MVWGCDDAAALQRKTDTKSNEITATPELLKVLDLRGATVTIDAIGCQREIAKTTIDGEGSYVLTVKDNQPTLVQDIQLTFAEAADARQQGVPAGCALPGLFRSGPKQTPDG